MLAPAFGLLLALATADTSWQAAVDKEGWIEVRSTDEIVVLLKRSGAPSSFWMRAEQRSSSGTALIRYDCSAWTLQITQTYRYSEPNMEGDVKSSSETSAAEVPPPGSLLDSLITAICEPA